MLVIEPYDEIQVFIKGTGCCLWGRIQPESEDGKYMLQVTVQPLPSTIAELRSVGIDVQPFRPVIGQNVTIPARLVDVVFGDDRHFAAHG